MRKGMKHMSAISAEINKIIDTPIKRPTKSEAQKTLRSCGILNQKNGLREAYKEILVKDLSNGNGKR